MDNWLNDVRFATRLLRKSPLFTITAVLSLAIGIGANATIFSVASAILLRPLPGLAQPDRLVDVGRSGDGPAGLDTVSYPNYADIRDRVTTLTGVYAHQLEPTPMSLGGRGEAERIYGTLVSGNYFETLGTQPALGRLLRPADDVRGGEAAVTVISHDLWTHRFASDPDVVGTTVQISGYPFAVVGVAPAGFQGTTLLKGDLWVPLAALTMAMPDRRDTLFTSRRSTWLFMGARLADGATIAQANAELASISAALQAEHPRVNERMSFHAAPSAVVPGMTGIMAAFIGLLMGIVTLLLLIACVNLAGMMLARGAARSREIAVRLAIGAQPRRIARQLLTETAVLFVLGGLAGLVLSRWLTSLLLATLPQLPVPLSISFATDWRVVAFTVVMSLVASVLCGLAPALQARRTSLLGALKADAGGPVARLRLRNVFVVGQVTMSLVLVITAGLFMRALDRAATMPTGFDQTKVDVVSLDLSLGRLNDDSGRAFARELLERTRALPGVQSATIAVDLPLDGGRMGFGSVRIPAAPSSLPDGRVPADWNIVEPGFFRTLGVDVVRGRDFTGQDVAGSPGVVIVNEAFARAVWPGQDAVGQRVEVDTDGGFRTATIIGVAADARFLSVADPADPYIYAPLAQVYHARVNLLVKTAGLTVIPEVRNLVRAMNPNLPVTEAMALSEITAINTIPQRVVGAVAATLGVVGLLLAAMGIYGVTAYAVHRRTREIGIRVALGADHREVLWLLLRQGAVLTAAGLALGIALAAAGAQLIRSLLYGISGIDPVTFGAACALFATVALVATYVPARRALAVDPMSALKSD